MAVRQHFYPYESMHYAREVLAVAHVSVRLSVTSRSSVFGMDAFMDVVFQGN